MNNTISNYNTTLKNIVLTPNETKAIEVFFEKNEASSQIIMRELLMNFGDASRLLDSLEDKHIINKSTGRKQRKLLISKDEFETIKKHNVI